LAKDYPEGVPVGVRLNTLGIKPGEIPLPATFADFTPAGLKALMGPVRYAKLESGWASTPWLEGAKEDFCASIQNFEYARAAAQKMSTLLFQSFWDKYSNCLSHSTLIRAGSGAQTGCRKPFATWAGTWSTSIGGFALRVLYPSTSRSPRKKHTQPSCTTSSDARDRSTTAAVTSIPATRARSWAVARRRIYLAGGGVTRMETQARSTSRSARRIRRSSQVGRNLTARRQRTRGQAPGLAISTGTAPDHHVSTHRRHPAVKARSVSENVADRLYGQALSRREDRDGQAVCLDDCAPTCLRSTGGCG
jgi:hypothetical protein